MQVLDKSDLRILSRDLSVSFELHVTEEPWFQPSQFDVLLFNLPLSEDLCLSGIGEMTGTSVQVSSSPVGSGTVRPLSR